MKMRAVFVGVFALALSFSSVGFCASGDLGLDFSGGILPYPNAATTLGWSFTLSQPRFVTALGIWDEGADGLFQSHPVALWASTGGSPLVTTTVTSSSTPRPSMQSTGQWLFQDLPAPVLIQPGTYVVGAYYEVGYPTTTDVDLVRTQFSLNYAPPTLSTDPALTYGLDYFNPTPASAITFPSGNAAVTGVFGPNLLLDVPEPASLGVIGLSGFLFVRRPARSRRPLIYAQSS